MGRNYETVCIIRPDLGDDAVKGIIGKATSTIESSGGKVTRLDDWGRRRLAYSIGKKNEGYYFVLNYNSSPEASKEVERQLRLNEDVLRYQTVKVERLVVAEPKKEAAPAEPAAEKGGSSDTE